MPSSTVQNRSASTEAAQATIEPFEAGRRKAVEDIFFATSRTRHHATPGDRIAFRERWLDRYLDHHADMAFVAVARAGHSVGYVVGALGDPASDPLFADLGYFQALSDLTAGFPAHLHVNVLESWRSDGVGARLVAQFSARATSAGAPGIHIVTAEGARNVDFYRRAGFAPLRAFDWNGAKLLMMGRVLERSPI